MSVKLDMIGLAVRNMGESLRFYRLLGMDIPEGLESEPHAEVQLEGIRMAWDTVEMLRGVYGEWNDHPVGHRVELALKCSSRDDVDAVYSRAIAHNASHGHKAPWDAFWGQRYAIVADPDGNLISLFA